MEEKLICSEELVWGGGVERVDEVGEHQRHDHQQVRDALVNRRPCMPNNSDQACSVAPETGIFLDVAEQTVNRRHSREKDSPSLVGAGAGACASATAGMATAKTNATAAKARPSGVVLAMAAGPIPLSLRLSACTHVHSQSSPPYKTDRERA